MDSISFAFLAWAAYALAIAIRGPGGESLAPGEGVPLAQRTSSRTLALAVACLVLIDVIIDPLAVRGDRWFLGKIFEYPRGGAYFGVPLSNFAGWAVVGSIALALYAALDRRWEVRGWPAPGGGAVGFLLGGALWYAVAAFNLIITFAIGETALGLVGLTFAGAPAALLSLSKGAARAIVPPPGRAARTWHGETLHR
jgi:putative membrane protein